MGKKLGNLDFYACSKIKDLVDPKADEKMRISSSYPFRHKTTFHCQELKAKSSGNWTMQQLKF